MTHRRSDLATLFLAAIPLSLAACVGGGEDEPVSDLESIRQLTGLSAPTETPEAQDRPAEILARSNSLILTTIHGETGNAEFPTFRHATQCSGTQCTVTEPLAGTEYTIDLPNTPLRQGAPTAIGSKHGITLIWESSTDTGAYLASLGAWLENSSFAILNESQTSQEGTVDVWYGIAVGDLAGTLPGNLPAGVAAWRGIMVGTPVTGEGRGERLVGDAVLTYDFPFWNGAPGPSLHVAFGGIKNIDRGTAHIVETVLFENVEVGTEGTFGAGFVGSRIQGAFYGPDHAEAAGVFEQQDIIGAFGANRQ